MKEELNNILKRVYSLDDINGLKVLDLENECTKLGLGISELKESTDCLGIFQKKNKGYEICLNINNEEYINITIFKYLIYCFMNNDIKLGISYIKNEHLIETENKIEIVLPCMKLIYNK